VELDVRKMAPDADGTMRKIPADVLIDPGWSLARIGDGGWWPAVERGLATATWYSCPIPRKRLKELMQRRDGPAIRDTIIWFAAFAVTGGLGYLSWGTWWAVPCFIAYGALYGSSSDSRWHECGHGTAFKTRWMNDVIYQIACFMVLREPTPWRWSHTRHHTDTLIVGRDPEIAVPRPPDIAGILMSLLILKSGPKEIGRIFMHCLGKIHPEEEYIPESEYPKVFRTARIWVAIWAAVVVACFATGSILPAMYVGILPSVYGGWLYLVFGLTQHAGMAEDVLDHRLNSRTVYMNPVLRFLYWNMNYHVEHHMFPLVPFHALPALHAEIKHDLPTPSPSIIAAFREFVPVLREQRRNPDCYVVREIGVERAASPSVFEHR
jgi:fatty acid desaturase